MLAAGITSIVIISLLSTWQDLEVTKHKFFPKSLILHGCTLTIDLALSFVTHKVLNIMKHMVAETPEITGYRLQLIPGVLVKRLAFYYVKQYGGPSKELPYDPAISLLGIYLDKTIIQKDTCTSVFIAALFTIAKTWEKT